MGNWSERQEVKRECKEKDKVRREKMAGFFYDMAKLSFAGLVIGVILPLYSDITKQDNWYAVVTGSILTIMFAWIGNKILK